MTTADGVVLGATQILGTAPRNQAFNVVLLAEGFTTTQQNDFNTACNTFINDFRVTPPFNQLSTSINVFRVNVSSTDSGADDPVSGGGTGATVRTYFDASFGGAGIRRLLICDTTTALQVAAAQIPEFSVVLVVVNSTIYGGSGGTVGTFSLALGASEVAIHEMGHTAFGLADEYDYLAGPDSGETGQDIHPPAEPSQPNVTINTDRDTVKWRSLIASTTTIPTMSNPDCSKVDRRPSSVPIGTVGLFEGAHYYHCKAYRPEYDCKMRALGQPFCQVCQQVILGRIPLLFPTEQGPLLHLVGTTSEGRLWHTIRFTNTFSWQDFRDVEGPAGDRGDFSRVATAEINGELHVCGVTSDGHLWHTIRFTDGSWQGFGDVEGPAGDRGSFSRVGIAEVNGELHLCGITGDGRLWHTIRFTDGSWQGFGDVEGPAGDRGSFVRIGIAEVNGDLQVCGITGDGRLWHTIRFTQQFAWQGFGNVEEQAGDRGDFVDVDCANVNGELHVCGTSSDGQLWHTIRYANGSWQSFGNVEEQAGDRGDFTTVSAAGLVAP